MSEPTLKPCPFCAGTKIHQHRNFQLDGMTFTYCDDCGAVVSFVNNILPEQAAKCWNRREQQK